MDIYFDNCSNSKTDMCNWVPTGDSRDAFIGSKPIGHFHGCLPWWRCGGMLRTIGCVLLASWTSSFYHWIFCRPMMHWWTWGTMWYDWTEKKCQWQKRLQHTWERGRCLLRVAGMGSQYVGSHQRGVCPWRAGKEVINNWNLRIDWAAGGRDNAKTHDWVNTHTTLFSTPA